MIETLKARVNGDEALVRRGRFLTTMFLLEVGPTAWLISIFEGQVVSVTRGPFVMPSSSFALRAPEEEWTKFWSHRPQLCEYLLEVAEVGHENLKVAFGLQDAPLDQRHQIIRAGRRPVAPEFCPFLFRRAQRKRRRRHDERPTGD